jgi:hypothetical protein
VDVSDIGVLYVKTSENTSHCVNVRLTMDSLPYTRVGFVLEVFAAANSMQVSYALPEV